MINLQDFLKSFKPKDKDEERRNGQVVLGWVKEALNSGYYEYTGTNSIRFFKSSVMESDYEARDDVPDPIETTVIEVSWK